ncbi:MAG: hypothetical protein J1F35_03630 [Erysipelotrichales bacterium]|nr:hypothetical protein [Erysipelotrichales bacterium]
MKITSGKKFVCSYDYSDFNQAREHLTKEIIEGRPYIKLGRYCATTFVGDVYKQDVEDGSFKYIMLIGISRQHPNERQGTREKGVEVAAMNAKFCPIMEMKFASVPNFNHFKNIVENYLDTLPLQYIRTKQESEKININNLVENYLENQNINISCTNSKINTKYNILEG